MNGELVYVVHSDQAIAAHVGDSLRGSDYKVVTMTTEAEAEAALSGHQFILPDAILTPLGDIESGDSILIRLFTSNPLMEQIPLVVLATHEEDQRRRALRLGLLSVIFPPYDQEEIALTTQLAIEKHRSEQLLFGSLSQLSVPDLLQTAEVGRRSGVISFQHEGYRGRVWLREGRVVNAEIEGLCTNEEAVYLIALWETGTFEANFGSVSVEETINILPSELLLEAMRRYDEGELPTLEELSGSKAALKQSPLETVLDLSLTILNVAGSYALNHLEPTLLEGRLERARQSMLPEHPCLRAFDVNDGGLIALGEEPPNVEPTILVDAVGAWTRTLFAQLESALAWRFSPKRLAHLVTPWQRELETSGFSQTLGIANVESDEGEDSIMRASPMHEATLPCGCFTIDDRAVIERYSPYGSAAHPRDPASYSGQALLAVLPPKMGDVARQLLKMLIEAEQRTPQALLKEIDLDFGYRAVSARIGLVRAATSRRFILTVNRVRGDDLLLSPELVRDPARGTLSDGMRRILAANDDFFAAFNMLFARGLSYRRHELLHRFGKQWGLRHVLRIERVLQRQFGMTLREVESQMAIEALAESVGVLGLGHFDVDLNHRDSGVIVIVHRGSPFPSYGSTPTAEGACSILAGFYAALMSYLSGRQLAAREVSCSRSPDRPCRFVVATEERLTKLLVARPGTSDHDLLVEIGAESALLTYPGRHEKAK